MAITLHYNVKPGDMFRYQATFTTQSGGKRTVNTNQSAQKVVAVSEVGLQILDPNDPEALVMVYDLLGYPTDMRQNGVSVKDDMPGDAFDISNALIFPDRPVSPGDTWAADDGAVQVTFQLIGTGLLKGREAAEVHATTSGYNGPIKYWVELATGKLLRQEYVVGGSSSSTTTVVERL